MVDSLSPPPPRSATDLFSDPLDTHPLWFKPNLFLSPDFDSESYISELRTFVPFDTLRSELQSYLSSLNHELIDLINRDYADFVNLSTKLVDVDSAVVRMRAPLLELREKIEGFRGSVESSLVALRNGLQQRSDAASAREALELLLDTFHVVSKVEKLIKELPSVPGDWSNGDVSSTVKNAISNGSSLQSVENGTNLRETQSMLLERIASEMNRLKFYIAHSQYRSFLLLRTWKRGFIVRVVYWMQVWDIVLWMDWNTEMKMQFTIVYVHMLPLIILVAQKKFFARLLLRH